VRHGFDGVGSLRFRRVGGKALVQRFVVALAAFGNVGGDALGLTAVDVGFAEIAAVGQ